MFKHNKTKNIKFNTHKKRPRRESDPSRNLDRVIRLYVVYGTYVVCRTTKQRNSQQLSNQLRRINILTFDKIIRMFIKIYFNSLLFFNHFFSFSAFTIFTNNIPDHIPVTQKAIPIKIVISSISISILITVKNKINMFSINTGFTNLFMFIFSFIIFPNIAKIDNLIV